MWEGISKFSGAIPSQSKQAFDYRNSGTQEENDPKKVMEWQEKDNYLRIS